MNGIRGRPAVWFVALVLGITLAPPATAEAQDSAELARQSQNPIASLITLPIQNNTNFGIGPFDRTQNITNIQPVIPTSLGEWALINRTIIPLVNQPDVGQAEGSTFGLGDIVYQGFFTPPATGAVTWGFGPVIGLATATDDAVGSGKWTAGPTAVLVASVGKWVLGGVVYNAWSFAGDSDRASVNQGFLQPFLNYNLANAWYLSSSPAITANWEASAGNKWIVPLGGGVGKVFNLGTQPVNALVQGYWNVVKPDALDGPDWTLRLQLNFLFPR